MDLLSLLLNEQLPETQQGETTHFTWQWLGEGMLQCTPTATYDKSIILSAGIHGNETAPIELLAQIIADIFSNKLALTERVLFIFGNPAGIRQGIRYLENDVNRMFCGGHQALLTALENAPNTNSEINPIIRQEIERAVQLEQAMIAFFETGDPHAKRYHYDLHTAIRASLLPVFALLPYVEHQPYDDFLLDTLNAGDLDAVVYHNTAGKTMTSFSAEHCHASSVTLELGKALPFGQNDLAQFSQIDSVLRAIISSQPLPTRQKPPLRQFKVKESILKTSDNFVLHIANDAPNFTTLEPDSVMAQDGETLTHYPHPVYVLFPNPTVKVGLRAGLVLEELVAK